VKGIAKKLLETKIYPSMDDLRESTEKYLGEVHREFFNSFKKSQWRVYYEKHVYQSVSYTKFYI
jgi:hypothetical protein